jgi:uncharacterized membrane protein YesL
MLIVTAGAGTAAAYETCRKYLLKGEGALVDVFTGAFRENWKQSTIVALIGIPFTVVAILTLSLAPTMGVAQIAIPLLIACLFLIYLFFWCVPLITRFNNPLPRHLRNGFTLGLTTPGLTLVLLVGLILAALGVWRAFPLVFVLPLVVLLGWTYLLERFFVKRGYVPPEPVAEEE